jgi:hypothetical protein
MVLDKRLILLATMIAIGGCSTQPRQFDARLASPPADREAYVRDFASCQLMARNNSRSTSTEKTGAALASIFTSDGISVAQAIRSDREEQLKAQMTECLAKQGYSVSGWKRVSKNALPSLAIAQTAKDPVPTPSTK